MGLLGDDHVIVKGDPNQHGAGYPPAPPPAAHQARSEDLSLHLPTSQPPAAQTSPCPAPSWAHFRRKRETRSICTTWSRKGDTAEEPVVSATRQIHNMGLSVQTKNLQGGLLLAVSRMAMDIQPQARCQPLPCRPERSLCQLRAWASPLPAAVGVWPGVPTVQHYPHLP